MRGLIILSFFLQSAIAADVAQAPRPSWVEPLDGATFADADQRYAGYTYQMLFDVDGVQTYSEFWIRATDASSLDAAAQIEIPFDATYQHAVVHHVDVLRNGRLESRLTRTKMEIVGRESELDTLLFTGRKAILLVVDDVRVGDLVRYAYSIEGRNPVYEDRIFAELPLAWEEPVQHVRYRLLHDRERQLQFRAVGADAPDVTPRRRQIQRQTVLEWNFTDVAERSRHHGAPVWYIQHPVLQVSEYRSWHDVAAWAATLFEHEFDADALAAHLPAGLGEADIRELVDYVQNDIRYYGIAIGQNSHRPHPPAVTAERRFGDCKDKSVLLAALLRQRGIAARPLLVSTQYGGAVGDMLPSPSAFDHAIVEFEWDGRRIWIDPTRPDQSGPIARRAVGDFGVGLPVSATADELVPIESHAQGTSTVRSVEHYRLSIDDDDHVLSVETRYEGAAAEFYRGAGTVSIRSAIEQQYLGYYARLFPDAELHQRLDIARDDDAVTIREAYRLGGSWQNGMTQLPVYAGLVREYAALPDGASGSRRVPFALPYPVHVVFEARIDIPEGVDLPTAADGVTIEDDYVVYLRSIDHSPGLVVVRHDFRTKRDHVPASSIRAHIATRRELLRALDLELTFGHPSHQRVLDRNERLRRLLDRPR
jgi:hypothetical protein